MEEDELDLQAHIDAALSNIVGLADDDEDKFGRDESNDANDGLVVEDGFLEDLKFDLDTSDLELESSEPNHVHRNCSVDMELLHAIKKLDTRYNSIMRRLQEEIARCQAQCK